MKLVPAALGRDYFFIFLLVAALAIATAAGGSIFGPLLWGYTGWSMHKGNNDALVNLFRALLILQLIAATFLGIYLGTFDDGAAIGGSGFSSAELLILILFAIGISSSLLVYFRRKMKLAAIQPA